MEVGQADGSRQADGSKKIESKSRKALAKVQAKKKLVKKIKDKAISKKSATKSRHAGVLQRRISKWKDMTNRGDVIIESLVHPLKNGKACLSMRQFCMNKQTGKPFNTFGDLMVLHSDNLDKFIEQLKGLRDQIEKKKIDKIVIDEWDLNSDQSKDRRDEAVTFAVDKMKFVFLSIVKDECEGCEVNEPSQRHHQCCRDLETNLRNLFYIVIDRIDWSQFKIKDVNFEELFTNEK